MNYLTYFKGRLDNIYSRLRKIEKTLCGQESSSGNKNYIISSTNNTLNENLPLSGWTQPIGAAEGDTAIVNFNYNTQGHYTYQEGQWVYNFKTGLGYNYVSGVFIAESEVPYFSQSIIYHTDYPGVNFQPINISFGTEYTLQGFPNLDEDLEKILILSNDREITAGKTLFTSDSNSINFVKDIVLYRQNTGRNNNYTNGFDFEIRLYP